MRPLLAELHLMLSGLDKKKSITKDKMLTIMTISLMKVDSAGKIFG